MTRVWVGFCAFLAIAAFFLWEQHRAHVLGAVPYVLLLLCPFIHFEPARWLGFLLGGQYARWCTQRMAHDAAKHFTPGRGA